MGLVSKFLLIILGLILLVYGLFNVPFDVTGGRFFKFGMDLILMLLGILVLGYAAKS